MSNNNNNFFDILYLCKNDLHWNLLRDFRPYLAQKNIELTKTITKYRIRLDLNERLYSHPYLEQDDFCVSIVFHLLTEKGKTEDWLRKGVEATMYELETGFDSLKDKKISHVTFEINVW